MVDVHPFVQRGGQQGRVPSHEPRGGAGFCRRRLSIGCSSDAVEEMGKFLTPYPTKLAGETVGQRKGVGNEVAFTAQEFLHQFCRTA